MPERRILITGGKGLVGSAIDHPDVIKVCRQHGDLRNLQEAESIFRIYEPTHVIHCAAKVGGISPNMRYGGDFYRDNILINTNVIDCCQMYQVEKIINFASTCIFPDKVKYPLHVGQIFDGPPHPSNAPYAYAKRMAMVQLKAYWLQHGLKSTTIIPCNIYGPHDNYQLDECHVIPALISKCCRAKKYGKPFIVWGSGTPLREFIYSKDVAQYALHLLDHDCESMIVSVEKEISIKEVALMIAKIIDFTGDIIFDNERPDGQHRKPSNSEPCSRFREGKFELTPFEEGLREAIKYFQEEELKWL